MANRSLPANDTDTETPPPSAGQEMLRSLMDAAQQVLSRRFRVVLLVRDAYDRMTAHPSALSAVWADLQTLLRLVIAWLQRSYRRISWTPLVIIVGGLIYFVTPTDLIPDMLGAIGFVDDVTVISTVVHTVRDELDRFREWEQNHALPQ